MPLFKKAGKKLGKELLKKQRLEERRRFYDAIARANKEMYKLNKIKRRPTPNTFKIVFAFSPTELGIDYKPTQSDIEKFGEKRAQHRLKYKDFFTHVPFTGAGKPTPENIKRLRAQVLEDTIIQLNKAKFQSFTTTAGESNEVESGTVITTEL